MTRIANIQMECQGFEYKTRYVIKESTNNLIHVYARERTHRQANTDILDNSDIHDLSIQQQRQLISIIKNKRQWRFILVDRHSRHFLKNIVFCFIR